MDQLLAQLGALFLGALPSAILLIVLFLYLRVVLFQPLQRILDERHSKMGGRELKAADTLKMAERKLQEYNDSLQAARTEIYSSQEQLRRRLEAERDAAIATTTEQAKAHLATVRRQLDAEVAEARTAVAREATQLAASITDKLIPGGRAS
ncbi:MAG: ATP synthase F0 subunit B [Bryobacterales bacterium]|jgi:F-type H+-transporting ATPase subunit b|nr:ATP synthase F0 subunit B [Bryobacterales bacterium]